METQVVDYRHDDTALEGYLAYDDPMRDKRPGVLVIPDFVGVNAFTKKRCEMIAELEYVGFVADVYGKSVRPASHQEALRKPANTEATGPASRPPGGRARCVSRDSHGRASRIAVIGYCFGSMAAPELACAGADILGTVL